MANASFQAKIAQVFSYVWRFQTLRVARAVSWGGQSPLILDRQFAGYRLSVDVSRTDAQRLLYLEGQRFVKERSLIGRLVKPGMIVVDVGANIGYYMLLFADHVGENGNVICFEPEPENLHELKLNRRRNELENVEIVEAAVGARNETVGFALGLNGKVSSEGTLEVPMVKLDSAIEGKVDVIKIDVEGYEGAVLDGVVNTIEAYHPDLLVEIHPWVSTKHSHEDIFSFMEDRYANVEYYEIHSPGIWGKATQQYLGCDPVVQIQDKTRLLADCMSGRRERTFWTVCCNANQS